jgi:Leukotriene A4 hydrolase, C-terminal
LQRYSILTKTPFDFKALELMETTYSLKSIGNAEVKCRWSLLALAGKYTPAVDGINAFVTTVGRMKFVRPIYKALKKYDDKLAKDTFLANKEFYHPICGNMVKKDLGL